MSFKDPKLLFAVACLLFAPIALSVQETTRQTPDIVYSGNPDTVVFLYDIDPGEIAGTKSAPLLRIYGDGRVHLHYPPYSKQAGDYEVYLTDTEMRNMLAGFSKIMSLDAAAAKRRQAEAALQTRQQTGVVFALSDDTMTRFEIQVDSFKATANAIARPVRKKIVWANLRSEAKRFPNIQALQDLSAADRTVRELLAQLHARQDMNKLDNP